MKSNQTHTNTHTHTTVLRLYGFCPGQPGWAGTRRNIHPLTPIVVIIHPLSASFIYYDPWHPPAQSMHLTVFFHNLQVFFGLPLGLAPSTSYSIHFFTQSLSSFRNTCPYHRNLFCCSIEIMSSNTSFCLNPLSYNLSVPNIRYRRSSLVFKSLMYLTKVHGLYLIFYLHPKINILFNDILTSVFDIWL